MRLAPFIHANVERILAGWEAFAGSLAPGARMSQLALRNDAEAILLATVRDMQSHQSLAQQASKSEGHGGAGGEESERLDDGSALHGLGRVDSGFDIVEVASEYRALRASVLRLWRESRPQPDLHDIDDITRFNESMDQSLAKAISTYTRRVEQSRSMFLAVLAHDLRNPLTTIRMAAHAISHSAGEDPRSARALSMIESNTQAIARLTEDLMDFASTGLGKAIPLKPGPVNLEQLCREVLDGFRSAHPDRTVRFHSRGDLAGEWDAARLRQVISNLMGNGLQHGSVQGPVELSLASEDSGVVLRVRNEGTPIPLDMLTTIFDPLVRRVVPGSPGRRAAGSIGLGLYIVREIVVAHAGTVTVTSTEEEGTTFTVRLPRLVPSNADARVGAEARREQTLPSGL